MTFTKCFIFKNNMKLIITDLDGTLFNSKKEVSQNDLNKIKQIQQSHLFTIATSRYYKSIKYLIRQLNITCPIITSNGSFVYDPSLDKVLLFNPMTQEVIDKIKTYALDNGYPLLMQSIDDMYVSYNHPRVQFFKKRNEKYLDIQDHFFPIETDFTQEIKNVYQMSVGTKNPVETSKRFKEVLKEEDVNVLMTGDDIVVITPKQSSKANGIKVIQEMYHLTKKDIIVFGDDQNDISMFEYCKHAVAMQNATDSIKALSEFVTKTNDESGFSFALETFYKL